MNIGLVIYGSLEVMSGGNLFDRKLVEHLRSRGDTVDIISIPPGSYSAHLLRGLSFRLPPGYDIIIEDELVHPSVPLANRHRSVPVISLVHNLHSSERRPAWQNAIYRHVEKWHLRSVDGYIFNSTITQQSVSRLVPLPKPFVLAPPGGDRLGSLSLDVVRQRLAAPGPIRLLFLANVTPLKGLHLLLDALKSQPAGACLLNVAGSLTVDARYAAQMRRLAASLPVPVTFRGLLDGASLVDMLKSSDVLVVPSYWEGFGIAYLEGMAFGLPAIGTAAGAIPQMIRDGDNGFTIPPGDSAALARLIARLASDRALLARLSEGALRHYSASPTWDESAASIRRFLLRMAGR